MSVSRRYVLDANVFIEAHQRYYPFDICPGYWDGLARLQESKRVCSVDKVKNELIGSGDRLDAWARDDARDGLFKGTADRQVIEAFQRMARWVQSHPNYSQAAKARFMQVADGWVVAYAEANKLVVVTHEAISPEARNRVPIPNLCVEFGVATCNTFEMLRESGVRLVLARRARRRK